MDFTVPRKYSLLCISPLDGRYRSNLEVLSKYFSEYALIRERVKVELQYLKELSRLEEFPLDLRDEGLPPIYENFTIEDALTVVQIEKDGYKDIPATNHDVKAVEYFLRDRLEQEDIRGVSPYIHFGLTSEDVNNLAYGRLIRQAIANPLGNQLKTLVQQLKRTAELNSDQPMLARTHGQPATPTTLGKEFSVYLNRLLDQVTQLFTQNNSIQGKLCGASGNLNAHYIAYPEIDWVEFSRDFVSSLGLVPNTSVTQIKPRDDISSLLQSLVRINNILLDLAVDTWTYISMGYIGQKREEGEVGSSTMPHKLNPIDFENAEGNLNKANSDLNFLADHLTKSRLQRDLSDSTVMRNIGVSIAHSLLGYSRLNRGIKKLSPRSSAIEEDLEKHSEILTEAWQTLLRKSNHEDAYELVKERTRGESLNKEDLLDVLEELPIPEEEKAKLRELDPSTYLGYAGRLTDDVTEEAGEFLENWDRIKSGATDPVSTA